MGWDVVAMDLPKNWNRIDELPEGFVIGSLGKRSDLIRKVEEVVPDADFHDPSWGQIVTPEFVIEVSMGQEDTVNSIGFHVHGDGAMAVTTIGDILDHLDLRAIVLSTREYFSRESALESFEEWRDWKNEVLSDEKF